MEYINTALTILATVSLFLAVVAIRAARRSADRVNALDYSLMHAQEHGRERWSRANDRIDSLEKALFGATGEIETLKMVQHDALERRPDVTQDVGRVFHKVHSLAAHLGLYWDEQCRWSPSAGLSGAAQGAGQVASQGAPSGNAIRSAKARGRRA